METTIQGLRFRVAKQGPSLGIRSPIRKAYFGRWGASHSMYHSTWGQLRPMLAVPFSLRACLVQLFVARRHRQGSVFLRSEMCFLLQGSLGLVFRWRNLLLAETVAHLLCWGLNCCIQWGNQTSSPNPQLSKIIPEEVTKLGA